MVTAGHRRLVVEHLKNRRFSERRAWRLAGFSHSASWRPLKERDDQALRSRLKTPSERINIEDREINRKCYPPKISQK